MVFRKVPAGTYTVLGTSVLHAEENWGQKVLANHTVKFPVDFYIAIFRLTKAQYAAINGDLTQTDKSCQIVNMNTIRGSAGYTAFPTTGPIYNIRNKTGLYADIPTRAMLRVAGTAGVACFWADGSVGTTPTASITDYIWCADNKGSNTIHTVPVGALKPNNWGIYDAAGLYHLMARDCVPGATSGDTSITFDVAERNQANGFIPVPPGDATKWTYQAGHINNAISYNSFNGSWWGSTHEVTVRLAIFPQGYYPSGKESL